MDSNKSSQLFFSLIYSYQMQVMMHLGKLANPMTNKIEKDLEAAAMMIDMVEMMQDKTKNNLNDEEKRFIETVLSDLRINYVEEKAKGDGLPADGASGASQESAENTPE